jgi:hypothetical protein
MQALNYLRLTIENLILGSFLVILTRESFPEFQLWYLVIGLPIAVQYYIGFCIFYSSAKN